MIKVILRRNGHPDEVIFMPQIPKKGEMFARSTDLRNTSIYRVTDVTWIVPYEGLTPSELECVILEVSW